MEHSVGASSGECPTNYSQIRAKSTTPPTMHKRKWVEQLPQICGYFELCKGISFGLAVGNREVSDPTVVAGWEYAPTALATCDNNSLRYI